MPNESFDGEKSDCNAAQARPNDRLRLTESAEQDLIEIWSFIAADNRTAASKLVREIGARFETVQDHPEIGPRRDRLAAGLRVHFHRDYALYYRFTASARSGIGAGRSRSGTWPDR